MKTRTGRATARRHPGLMVAVLVLVLAAGSVVAGEPDRRKSLVDRGHFLYGVYCASCHGDAGRGDGQLAEELKTRPADLTTLATGNDGVFPFARVYDTIDGREVVRGHGRRDMPVWGFAFQEFDKDTDQRDEVRGRILQLIEYLKTLQSDD